MKNKIIGIFVCMLLITICVIPVYGIESQNNVKKSSAVEILDSYVIENVPYVNQGDSWYCPYASHTMIFQYYGLNTSLCEVLFNSGIGYSLGYKIIRPFIGGFSYEQKITGPCLSISGTFLGLWVEDRQLLADIYGLNYNKWSCNDESISDDTKWQMYWINIKENISKNIPVVTQVMLEELPYVPNEKGGHFILVVGYNESNNTVCVHDSYAPVLNNSVSGIYIYIPIDCLKNSMKKNKYLEYLIETFEDTVDEPLPKEEAFKLIHSRNIQRMKGDLKAYDKEMIKSEFRILGVHSLTFLKNSYNIRNLMMLCIIGIINGNKYYNQCGLATYFYRQNSLEKHNMSQYLIENADLYPNAQFEAEMLEIESNNWMLLYHKNIELWFTYIFRLPSRLLVLKEIRNIIDVIISIEKDIIAGSHTTAAISLK